MAWVERHRSAFRVRLRLPDGTVITDSLHDARADAQLSAQEIDFELARDTFAICSSSDASPRWTGRRGAMPYRLADPERPLSLGGRGFSPGDALVVDGLRSKLETEIETRESAWLRPSAVAPFWLPLPLLRKAIGAF
jgi:hypothetical protein